MIYFAPYRNEPSFKIGFSGNPKSRIRCLGPYLYVLESCRQIEGDKKLEEWLHARFSDRRRTIDKDTNHQKGGHTEFFDIEIWDEVMDYVTQQTGHIPDFIYQRQEAKLLGIDCLIRASKTHYELKDYVYASGVCNQYWDTFEGKVKKAEMDIRGYCGYGFRGETPLEEFVATLYKDDRVRDIPLVSAIFD